MKGLGISVPPLHAGVRFDLEALLAAFKEKNSVRFEAFAEVFAALKMSLIFAGRQTAAELIEFEEHLLQLSAAYMMSIKSGEIAGYPEKFDPNAKPDIPSYSRSDRPPENLPAGVMSGAIKQREERESEAYVMTLVERMFGIYCCYSFYYLQPKDYMAQIRISPAQMRDITDFMEDRLRAERHLDAMACLYKLLNEGAFRITAFELMYDPACHKRYEAEDEDEGCLPPGADAPLERMQGLTEDRTMQQLEMLHKSYEKAKAEAGFKGVTHGEIDVMESSKRILENAKVSIQMEEIRSMGELGGDGAGGASALLGGNSSPSRFDIKKRAYSSGVTASRNRRYAFIDGDETVAISGEDSDEDTPGPSKGKKKKGRPSRKSQRDEKAEEFIQELQELGVQGVAKRRNTSPRKSVSMATDKDADSLLDEIVGGKEKKKRINKKEAKKKEAALVRVTKSKIEDQADRELAKLMKNMKEKNG